METYGIKDVENLFLSLCRICRENQESFTEADSRLGDGDMGITIGKGAAAVERILHDREIKGNETEEMSKLFMDCAMEWNRCAPSTLGTLISFGMMAVGKELNHRSHIEEDEIPGLVKLFADTIATRGSARTGDKTILDALYPYVETLRSCYEDTRDLSEALEKAAEAARQGMERTKGMIARTGRASWLNTRNMEYPDAGAVLMATVGTRLVGQE